MTTYVEVRKYMCSLPQEGRSTKTVRKMVKIHGDERKGVQEKGGIEAEEVVALSRCQDGTV